MDVDESAEELGGFVEENSEREVQPTISNRQRYSFGLDLTECTLDCSLELCDVSIASNNMHHEKFSPMSNLSSNLNVQESFEMDESLGILTPERMKEFLDSTTNIVHNLDLPLNSGKLKIQECRVDLTPSPEELPLDPVVEYVLINSQLLIFCKFFI